MCTWHFNDHLMFALQQNTPDQEKYFRWYLSCVPGWGLPGSWSIHVLMDPREKEFAAFVVSVNYGRRIAIQDRELPNKALDELAFQCFNEKFLQLVCRPLLDEPILDAETETILLRGPMGEVKLVCSGMRVFRSGIIKLQPYDGPDPYIPFRTRFQFVTRSAKKLIEAWEKTPEKYNSWEVEELGIPGMARAELQRLREMLKINED